MAVHSGRKHVPILARGTVAPRNRALGPIGKGIAFELPGATSDIRTLARTADVVATVIKAVDLGTDLRASVTADLECGFDARMLVVHPVNAAFDLQQVVRRPLRVVPDARLAVFRPMERLSDTALVVLHRVMSDADAKQTIYVYLFRESHEIQV